MSEKTKKKIPHGPRPILRPFRWSEIRLLGVQSPGGGLGGWIQERALFLAGRGVSYSGCENQCDSRRIGAFVMHAYREYPDSSRDVHFATTRWTIIAAAAQETGSSEARRALESLCRDYWFPLYAYLRRRGHSKDQAEDYTQAFFVHLLEKHGLERVRPGEHRFRSFLLASLKHFVLDDWRRARAQKRGGGRKAMCLETEDAEQRYCLEQTGCSCGYGAHVRAGFASTSFGMTKGCGRRATHYARRFACHAFTVLPSYAPTTRRGTSHG